jgi:hypothetical protein
MHVVAPILVSVLVSVKSSLIAFPLRRTERLITWSHVGFTLTSEWNAAIVARVKWKEASSGLETTSHVALAAVASV